MTNQKDDRRHLLTGYTGKLQNNGIFARSKPIYEIIP